MAATDGPAAPRPQGPAASALVAAALALPGILPAGAAAQAVADHGVLELKYLDYRDWQPGASRMTVRSPSLYTLIPLNDTTEFEGSLVYDAMSGASPLCLQHAVGRLGTRRHRLPDRGRCEGDQVFRRLGDWASPASCRPSATTSRAAARSTSASSPTIATGRTRSRSPARTTGSIRPTARHSNAPRNTLEYLVGITQALSPTQIVQSNVTYSYGHGYYNDPYKLFDKRPGERRIFAWLTRYNQYFAEQDGALRLSYRYLHDSFGSNSNTLDRRLGAGAAARVDGDAGAPLLHAERGVVLSTARRSARASSSGSPTRWTRGSRRSARSRSALDVAKALGDGWSVDLRVDFYRQQSNWRIGGGSPGILPFSARWVVVGLTKTF